MLFPKYGVAAEVGREYGLPGAAHFSLAVPERLVE